MSRHKHCSFLVLSVLNICALVSGINITVSDSADKPRQIPSLSPAAAAPLVTSPVFRPAGDSISSLNLLSSFPDDLEISDYCSELLHIFGQRYVAYVNCLVPAARPVKVCQSCFSTYGSLMSTYNNISSDQVCATFKVSFSVVPFAVKKKEVSSPPARRVQALFMRSCLMITSHVTD